MTRSAVLLLGCFAPALGALMGSAPFAPSQRFRAIGSLSAAARGPAPFRPSPVRPVCTLAERSQHVEMAYRDEDGDAVGTGPEGMDWDDDWRSFMRRRGLMRSHISTKVDGNVLVVSLDWHFWLGAAGGIVRRPPNPRPCPHADKPSTYAALCAGARQTAPPTCAGRCLRHLQPAQHHHSRLPIEVASLDTSRHSAGARLV